MKTRSQRSEEMQNLMDLYVLMPELHNLMRQPLTPLRVVVVDDTDFAIAGILSVLIHWPNLHPIGIVQKKSGGYPDILPGRDHIILLDENMGALSGTDILKWLKQDGFDGIHASISNDVYCPQAFKYHFSGKFEMFTSTHKAKEFILWMNNLISEAERSHFKL